MNYSLTAASSPILSFLIIYTKYSNIINANNHPIAKLTSGELSCFRCAIPIQDEALVGSG